MFAHPGKKLNFMGNEFGQLREWDEKRQQDWEILRYPVHDAFHRFMMDLNKLYSENPALYEMDYDPEGFRWLDCHQEERLIYAFERRSGKQRIAAVFNFSDEVQEGYVLEVKEGTGLSLLISSEMEIREKQKIPLKEGKTVISLPPYSGRYYLYYNSSVRLSAFFIASSSSSTRDFDWSPYNASSSAAVLPLPVSSSLASAS